MWNLKKSLQSLSPLLNLIFPSSCPVCNEASDNHKSSPVCSPCWQKIERHNRGCRVCAAVTSYDANGVCQECRFIKPRFDRIISYGIYDGVLKEVIHLMKFRQIKRLARALGNELTSLEMPSADCIMAVPLSIQSLRKREFNQSALIAARISRNSGIPLNLSGLIKTRETQPQSSLSKNERKDNVRNAFVAQGELKEKHVMLVDDVVTTGATVNECAKVLREAGAESVTVITAARAKSN